MEEVFLEQYLIGASQLPWILEYYVAFLRILKISIEPFTRSFVDIPN